MAEPHRKRRWQGESLFSARRHAGGRSTGSASDLNFFLFRSSGSLQNARRGPSPFIRSRPRRTIAGKKHRHGPPHMRAYLSFRNRGLRLADQDLQMMLSHDCAKEELCGTQRLSATQLTPTGGGAQILRQSLKSGTGSLGVENCSKLWRARRLGNYYAEERSGVFPGHHAHQADSQIKKRYFGDLVSCERTFRTGYPRRPPADYFRKQSFLAVEMPIEGFLGTASLRSDHLHCGIDKPPCQKYMLRDGGQFHPSFRTARNFSRVFQLLARHLQMFYGRGRTLTLIA
jgi:hypothetical protein